MNKHTVTELQRMQTAPFLGCYFCQTPGFTTSERPPDTPRLLRGDIFKSLHVTVVGRKKDSDQWEPSWKLKSLSNRFRLVPKNLSAASIKTATKTNLPQPRLAARPLHSRQWRRNVEETSENGKQRPHSFASSGFGFKKE